MAAKIVAFVIACALLVAPQPVRTQAPGRMTRVAASASALSSIDSDAAALSALRAWDTQLTALTRSGELAPISVEADTLVGGRTHERYAQRHLGVRVFGADLARQVNAFGQTESIFGTFYPDIPLDVTPAIDAAHADALIAVAGAGVLRRGRADRTELLVLPLDDGSFRLTWSARVMSMEDGHIRRIFIDAATGAPVLSYDDTQTQAPSSGKGYGVLGDLKKVSVDLVGSLYLAIDQQRPSSGTFFGLPAGANITYDMKGNLNRFMQLIVPLQSDIASDPDNDWSTSGVTAFPGIVDAHAYAGYTYDYYFRRFGRKGLDNSNLQIWSFTNIVRASDYPLYFNQFSSFFVNAAYLGGGDIYYGSGMPSNVTVGGKFWSNLAGALDVVAHELSHGVTDYSSQLIYLNESGALNEAFSDMMGQSAQFYFNPPTDAGVNPVDWELGEDVVRPGGLRSMATPFTYGNPDHYSIRSIGTADGGGVHNNSSIVNQMFYLAVQGGTNRVSGLAVQGVGFANRDQIEKVIYRAFTQLMTSSANFSAARLATIQAARDLYGAGSAAERAITQAWTAVGVP